VRARRTRIFWLTWLAGAVVWLVPPAARAVEADSTETSEAVRAAEVYAARAFEAYRQRQYPQAIELYEQAWAAAAAADILYNLARVYDLGSQQPSQAIRYYERYIAHPRALAERRALAEQRISALRAAAAAVSAGPQTTAAARRSEMKPAAADPVGAGTRDEAASFTGRDWTAALLGGAGLAALGTGAYFGWSAYAQSDAWRGECDGNTCASQRAVDAAESAQRQANVATLLLALGGAAVAAGAAVWWLGPDGREQGVGASLHLEPVLGSSQVGGALGGRF
jgi:hypothetical protein